MSEGCSLKIRTDAFRLELRGDAAFVRSGYEAMRDEILARLGHAHRSRVVASEPATVRVPSGAPGTPAASAEPGPDYVWVYRCTDLYNKVYVLQRRRLVETGLGRIVDLCRVHRIYIESEDDVALQSLVPPGKTLWSELTALGHQRLRTG